MKCVVCKNKSIEVFKIIERKKYWKCSICFAKFLDKSHYLDSNSEKNRYLEHNNNIDDPSYRKFLSKLSIPLEKKLSANDGYQINLYDPFFFPDKSVLEKKYNFITCTETVEHFFDPYQEFKLLDNLLLDNAWLGIMTCFLTKESQFENWYYRKDPTHVVFYAEETFHIIAEQRNWTCEIPTKDIVLLYKNKLN